MEWNNLQVEKAGVMEEEKAGINRQLSLKDSISLVAVSQAHAKISYRRCMRTLGGIAQVHYMGLPIVDNTNLKHLYLFVIDTGVALLRNIEVAR